MKIYVTHTYTHIYLHLDIYIYEYTCDVCVYIYISTRYMFYSQPCIQIHTCTNIWNHIATYTYTYIQTRTKSYKHLHMYSQTYIHIHAHTFAYIYIIYIHHIHYIQTMYYILGYRPIPPTSTAEGTSCVAGAAKNSRRITPLKSHHEHCFCKHSLRARMNSAEHRK